MESSVNYAKFTLDIEPNDTAKPKFAITGSLTVEQLQRIWQALNPPFIGAGGAAGPGIGTVAYSSGGRSGSGGGSNTPCNACGRRPYQTLDRTPCYLCIDYPRSF